MNVYKFRITFEDPDDVSRDIEIKPAQTFEDLHQAIQAAIGFDASKSASFFMSDDYWRKGKEIPYEILGQTKLAKHIDDPHQKFIYVFDPEAQWQFAVELFKILPEEKGAQYPRCVKAMGEAPPQYKKILPPDEDNDDDESINPKNHHNGSDFYAEPQNADNILNRLDQEENRQNYTESEEEDLNAGDFDERDLYDNDEDY